MKLILTKDKVTPGTVRFAKELEGGRPFTIYLPKDMVEELDNPESVSVTIEKES